MRTERSVFRGYAETSLNFVPEKIQLRRGNLAEPNRERERERREPKREHVPCHVPSVLLFSFSVLTEGTQHLVARFLSKLLFAFVLPNYRMGAVCPRERINARLGKTIATTRGCLKICFPGNRRTLLVAL